MFRFYFCLWNIPFHFSSLGLLLFQLVETLWWTAAGLHVVVFHCINKKIHKKQQKKKYICIQVVYKDKYARYNQTVTHMKKTMSSDWSIVPHAEQLKQPLKHYLDKQSIRGWISISIWNKPWTCSIDGKWSVDMETGWALWLVPTPATIKCSSAVQQIFADWQNLLSLSLERETKHLSELQKIKQNDKSDFCYARHQSRTVAASTVKSWQFWFYSTYDLRQRSRLLRLLVYIKCETYPAFSLH